MNEKVAINNISHRHRSRALQSLFMKTGIILVYLCLQSPFAIFGQVVNHKLANLEKFGTAPVILTIIPDTISQIDEFTVFFYDRILSVYNMIRQEPMKITGKINKVRNLVYQTDAIDHIGYIVVKKNGVFDGKKMPLDLLSSYLVEPGDNVVIKMVKDSVYLKRYNRDISGIKASMYFGSLYFFSEYSLYFSGTGSAKFACRYEADRAVSSYVHNYDVEMTSKRRGYPDPGLDVAEKIASDIFRKYETRINKFAYQILLSDYIAWQETDYFSRYKDYIKLLAKSRFPGVGSLIKSFRKDASMWPKDPDGSVINVCLYYPTMIIVRQEALNMDTTGKFSSVYDSLRTRFHGKSLDKVLTTYLVDYYYTLKNWEELLTDALAVVQTGYYHDKLNELKDKMTLGRPAYNFSLPDTAGNIVKLEDFKGKVVFIDFWYKACSWCIEYYLNSLSKIEKEFAGNPDVVFITINIDKDKGSWMEAIHDNKHTSLSAINLYTGGQGSDHPVIKYYNVIGYPRPILIDKEGKIFNVSNTELREADKLKNAINTVLNMKERTSFKPTDSLEGRKVNAGSW